MKIFGVLAILSTLYTQGTSLTCHKVEDFSDPTSITTADETCENAVTTCVRPKMTDATYEETDSKWGCGVCTTPASCVSCDTDNCNEEPFKCLATTDYANVAAESKFCPDTDALVTDTFKPAEKKCVRPIMKDGGTYEATDSKWGCGVCTTAANCVSCEDEECNKAPTFECLTSADNENFVTKVCPDRIPTGLSAFKPETACVRPIMKPEGTYADTDSKWGCGVCTTAANCVSCKVGECNVAPTFKCLAGAADAVPESKLCPDTDAAVDDTFVPETECVRPEFSYAVVGDVEYGCGNCKDGEGDDIANCITCAESDCNSIPTDPKHKCYTYSLGEDKKWAASTDMADCVSGDGDAGKCNMPADLAVEAGYSEGGCGPCKVDNAACKVTEAEKNVGQKAVVSLLVTILPLLYVML